MPLVPVVEKREDVPEGAREFYKQREDGKFVIDVDVEAHPQVDGLRKAVRAERERANTLAEKFKGVDVERWEKWKEVEDADWDAYQTWQQEQATNPPNGSGQSPEEIKAQAERFVAPVRKKLEQEKAQLEKALADERTTNAKIVADLRNDKSHTAMLTACTEAGVLSGAFEEITMLGMTIFKADEKGEVFGYDKNGDVLIGADGNPLKPKDWITSKSETKAHWWPRNSGGGAGGGTGRGLDGIRSKADFGGDDEKIGQWIKKHPGQYLNLPDK